MIENEMLFAYFPFDLGIVGCKVIIYTQLSVLPIKIAVLANKKLAKTIKTSNFFNFLA
ncbi:hypothetical protein [Campylobacter hyointestinalis]|uniref:hypothetical protein n=1 Tax=Campylobacter hyointestinalis TaxID=198 RepID=UPI00164E8DB6|nr:hypothetical protein [Campylobacter hyointestinalis]